MKALASLALSATLALLPVASSAEDAHDHDHDETHAEDHADTKENFDAHLSELDGLRVLHPWAIEGPDGLRVYLEIENQQDREIILSGGETHDGTALILVATRPGTEQSDAIGEIPIAAGADMELSPGELYLLLSPAPDVTVGDMVEAHLAFDPVGELDIEIEVFPSGTRKHPHAGHNH